MGPGGGEAGGRIIAKGTPEEIASDRGSITGKYLRWSALWKDRQSQKVRMPVFSYNSKISWSWKLPHLQIVIKIKKECISWIRLQIICHKVSGDSFPPRFAQVMSVPEIIDERRVGRQFAYNKKCGNDIYDKSLESEPGVVFKFFSASQQSMRSI